MSSRSALGWLALTARNSGSRTGLPDWLLVAIRARRARIRRPAGPPPAGRCSTGATSTGAESGALEGGLATRSSATEAPTSSTRWPVYVRGGRASDGPQAVQRDVADGVAPVQERQVHQHGESVHDAAAALDQLTGPVGGAAGGQHVVDEQHPVALVDAVLVHLEGRLAVLQRVGHRVRLARELAGLADRDEPGTEGQGHRRGQDEASGLHADDLVDDGVA